MTSYSSAARLPSRLPRASITLRRGVTSAFTTRTRSTQILGCLRHPIGPLLRSPSSALPSSSAPSRALCTAPADDDDRVRLPPFADECLRGVGQVVFCNSPASGAMILGALAVGDPWLAVNAAAGATAATAAARGAGLDAGATSAGLFGYNGCLVGCALSVFLGAPPVTTLAATVVGGGASAIVAAALKPAMGSVPQWTLAFNFTTLSALAYVRPLDGAAAIPADAGALELALSPLVGVSQIFVVNSPWAGAMMLAAIGHYSKGCAAHTLAGSCVGVATAAAVGAPAGEIAMGLWGFNPALTSLAVSVFFVNTPQAVALSGGSAAATAVLFGGAKTAIGAAAGCPALTLPFCAVASGCHLLGGAAPGLELAASPHSPEKNEGAKTTM